MCLGKVESQCGCWECSRVRDIGGGTADRDTLLISQGERSIRPHIRSQHCERFCLQTLRVRTNVLYVFSSFK